MASMNKTIVSALERLKKSPLFNFSLSSKELFHSDFLDWLCKNYPTEVMPIFLTCVAKHPDLTAEWKVEREKGHQDLKFSFHDGSVLVVENKVKSIPNEEQLQRYCRKFGGKPLHSFLLLSLVKPPFVASIEGIIDVGDDCRWAFLDYEDLARELKLILPIIDKRDLYHGKLLFDYIEFIRCLSEIAKASALMPESSDNFFAYHELMPNLKELRIHDLVYKNIFSEMAQFTAARLKKSGYNVKRAWKRENSNAENGEVYVDAGFSNGTGMFSVFYVVIGSKEVGGPCILFIQLQDKMFRLFLNVKGKKRCTHIAKILADRNLWFNFDKLPTSSIIKRKRKEMPFNRFGASDMYRYKLIDDMSPEQLAEITIEYVDQVKRNASTIRKIVRKATK